LGDYTGLPLTEGAPAADSWDASRLTLREHQCKVHNAWHPSRPDPTFIRGTDLRTQQLIAIHEYLNTYEQSGRSDGRPRIRPNGRRTRQGLDRQGTATS
jgi:hypothetical protein